MKTIEETIQLAHQFFLEEEFRKAAELYEELLFQHHIDGNYRLIAELEYSWALYKDKKYDETIAILTRISDSPDLSDQQRFDALRILGFSLAGKGDNISSIDALSRAVKMDIPEEDKRFVLFELGKVLFIQGNYGDSLTYFLNARVFFPEDDFYYSSTSFYIGFIYVFQNNLEDAFNEFIHLTEYAQNEELAASGLYGMAHIYFKTENYKGLLQVSRDITIVYPDFFDKETIAYFITKAYFKLEDWVNFRLFCEKLFQIYPDGHYKEEYSVFRSILNDLAVEK